MEYYNPNFVNKGLPFKLRALLFLSLATLVLYLDINFKYLEQLRQKISVFLHPIQSIADFPKKIAFDINHYFVTQSRLYEENTSLKSENFEIKSKLLTFNALKKENANLRKILQLEKNNNSSYLIAEIILTPKDSFIRKIIINKGSSDGIKVGGPVIDAKGLIGQITRVNNWSSEIQLVTDTKITIPTQVVRNGLRAVVSGGAIIGNLSVNFLPSNADIQVDDVLITSGLGKLYPYGLPVARITNINADSSSQFFQVDALPISNIENNNQVVVLLSDNDQY